MRRTVRVRNDHGACFCRHSDVLRNSVFVQVVSKEMRQGKDSLDAVLASADSEKAHKTRSAAIMRKILAVLAAHAIDGVVPLGWHSCNRKE